MALLFLPPYLRKRRDGNSGSPGMTNPSVWVSRTTFRNHDKKVYQLELVLL